MLVIYNTLTRQKEEFKPLNPPNVGIYICGVTVYDYCHLGHARTYTSADVMVRYLRHSGFAVRYVRNITDIDDKIIKRANEHNKSYTEITQQFIVAMQEDFAALNLQSADVEPRATAFIPQMIQLIEKLLANNNAYVARNGDVYFDIRRFPRYGCLSHHDIEQLESGVRVEIAEEKNDPLDFVLWKLAKPHEPSWDSPWGLGRPGWHIECSAMALNLLGETFDIHGGGRDLIFPHHENEIAQSECATLKTFANVWVHGGFLQVEKEKMSKSIGNFITIRDVLKTYSPEVLRYLLIASHYRSALVYSESLLQQAQQALSRLYTALRFHVAASSPEHHAFEVQFKNAMDDDFNTPVALSVLFELAHEIERLRVKDSLLAASYAALLRKLGNILGILEKDPAAFFQLASGIDVAKIEELIQARVEARKNKNWQKADEIRQTLLKMSVVIEDGMHGTTWKVLK